MNKTVRSSTLSALALAIMALSAGCDDSSSSSDDSGDSSNGGSIGEAGSGGSSCPGGSGFAVGDEGPAGGWIFFVNSIDSDDWTYLEAAPEDVILTTDSSTNLFFEWGPQFLPDLVTVDGTSAGIGTGKGNTHAIVRAMEEAGLSGRAAQRAAEHDLEDCEWFLPSKDELERMEEVLYDEGLGDFSTGFYWSSTEAFDLARQQAFARSLSLSFEQTQGKGNANRVRPVRRF